eukprot:5335289-Karenia_brevis.AAC.1
MADRVMAKALLDKSHLSTVRLQTLLRSPTGLAKTGMDGLVEAAGEVLNVDDAKEALNTVQPQLQELTQVWNSSDVVLPGHIDLLKQSLAAVSAGDAAGMCMAEPEAKA